MAQPYSPSLNRLLDTLGDSAAKSSDGAAHVSKEFIKEATAKINGELSRFDKGFGGQVGFQADNSPDELIANAKAALNTSDPLGLRSKTKAERMAIKQAYETAMNTPITFDDMQGNTTGAKAAIAAFVGMMGKTKATTTGTTTATGLVPYALDVPAFLLYPVITPLRKRTARRTVGGTQYRYKRVTGIDTLPDEGWVAEATATTTGRASSIAIDTDDKTATFKTLGLDDFYTQEMFYGEESKVDGANFDAVGVAGIASLQAYLMREERAMLWANGSQMLGKPTGLSATASQAPAGIGSLSAATAYDFKVSALTGAGLRTYKAKGHVTADANGETDGSVLASVTTAASGAGSTSVTLVWNSVKGAYAYNIYAGAHSGTLYYYATVFQSADLSARITAGTSSLTVTAIPVSGGVPNTADQTQSANAYDGLSSLIAFNGDSYLSDLLGQGFTSDGAGGILEITNAFKSLYDASSTNKGPVGVQRVYTGSSDRYAIDKLILGSTGHPNYTVFLSDGEIELKGGVMVTSLLNRFMNEQVALETHPYLPSGQVLGVNETMGPYFPNAKIPAGWEMMMGFDAVRIDYGITARKTEWGIYGSGAPIMRFPAAFFNIYNSGN